MAILGHLIGTKDIPQTMTMQRTEKKTLGDALDSLDHVCHTHDRSRTCLEQSGVRDECLVATLSTMRYQANFQFICHHRQRDETLLHSLKCFHDTRLLAMLYFHIAARCRGFGILDDVMARYKKAYFYSLDINGTLERTHIPLLYSLPKPAITTCVRDIIEDQCGSMTADFVQNYLLYSQARFGQPLRSSGLNSNICDHDIPNMMPSRRPIPS